MKRTLLLLAYDFPPAAASGAARPSRFYRYLPEWDILPEVLTASAQREKSDTVNYVCDEVREGSRRNWSWQFERFVRRLFLPGELGLVWSRQAATRGCEILDGAMPAAVFSTFPPLGPHLAARSIKRRLGVPWIADFRDPLPNMERSNPRRSIFSLLEALLVAGADAVIANTDDMYYLWQDRYPQFKDKFHVIWNGYDPAQLVTASPVPPRSYKHLVHIGELYGGRHPGPILAAMAALYARRVISSDSVQLSLLGPSSSESIPNFRQLRELEKNGLVEYRPSRIPEVEARRLNSQADALVLLQPQSSVQVPAKLFEFIRIGRPILAFVQSGSPSERILVRSGIPNRCVYPEDASDLVQSKLLEFLELSNQPVSPSKWFNEQFNAKNQSGVLADIVARVVTDGRCSERLGVADRPS